MKEEVENLNRQLTEIDLINKLAKYCAYQERCIYDLNKQYDKYYLEESLRNKITKRLLSEGFLNEERYVRSYINGKIRGNNWGKIKVAYSLKKKKIEENLIQRILDEFDETEYMVLISDMIKKKALSIKDEDPYIKKNKIAKFLIQKGFEGDLVWGMINSLKVI